jgi:hypothetical protein
MKNPIDYSLLMDKEFYENEETKIEKRNRFTQQN